MESPLGSPDRSRHRWTDSGAASGARRTRMKTVSRVENAVVGADLDRVFALVLAVGVKPPKLSETGHASARADSRSQDM